MVNVDNTGLQVVVDNDDHVLAYIIRDDYDCNGINFITPNEYSQQMAFMHHEKGHIILPHVHNSVKRNIYYTKEVLIIKSGIIRCDFYTNEKEYIKSVMLRSGDIILLVDGGHGFECIEETKMVEIKQGPYVGEKDKTRFEIYNGELRYDNE